MHLKGSSDDKKFKMTQHGQRMQNILQKFKNIVRQFTLSNHYYEQSILDELPTTMSTNIDHVISNHNV